MRALSKRRIGTGPVFDTRVCVPIDEAAVSSDGREGVENSLPLVMCRGLDTDKVKVRLGTRVVRYHITGCIPEQEHERSVTETVVVECPADPEKRCEECILNAGESAVAAYEEVVVSQRVRPVGIR